MSARITDETLLALVDLIYEAACDSAQWPQFLRAFAAAVKARGTIAYTHNFETMDAATGSDGSFPNAVVGFDPQFLSTLEEHYTHVNVWAENETLLQPGRPVTGSMLYPERRLPDTEFYQQWLRPQEYFHALGGVILREGPHAMKFSSLRSRRAGDFSSEEIRLYQALLPHLARAARIQHRFSFLQSLADSSLAALDTVPAAVLLLDASARVLRGNSAADAELRKGDPFRLGRSGELCVQGASKAQAELRSAIGAALDPVRSVNERLSTVAQVSRRSGEILSAQALPLPRSPRVGRGAPAANGFAACALVVHGVATRIPAVGSQLLRHVYGLTPAEVQVALAIAEGDTIKRYAERRRISRNTAASQLKRAFEKTGLRRQSELVRWLLQCGAGGGATAARYR